MICTVDKSALLFLDRVLGDCGKGVLHSQFVKIYSIGLSYVLSCVVPLIGV
jgi:hypothetical protein